MTNWLNVPDNHDFSIHNLPYGVAQLEGQPTLVVAIGDHMISMRKLAVSGLMKDLGYDLSVWDKQTLNEFMALGKEAWKKTRAFIINQLVDNEAGLFEWKEDILYKRRDAQMLLPVHVGDYTDFYSSIDHATNVGKMFRDPENALLPNWKHIPVGYHGRASSIVISGTDIKRPHGQQLPKGADQPIYGPCKLLDFELEMAFVVGKGNDLGTSISTQNAEDHIFGMVIFNDWSARDIQKWEYVPLGPFLGKNFGSTISPWIVTMEALEPFRTVSPKQDPEVLDYLKFEGPKNFDIDLNVYLDDGQAETNICHSNYKYMYWNMAQQLAHHTVNGCNTQPGDMMASGTISGPDENSFGSMLELSWAGSKEIKLKSGATRKFIQDGDTIRMTARAEKDGKVVGFGDCVGKIVS
jgi:fumarylacetoacetase